MDSEKDNTTTGGGGGGGDFEDVTKVNHQPDVSNDTFCALLLLLLTLQNLSRVLIIANSFYVRAF